MTHRETSMVAIEARSWGWVVLAGFLFALMLWGCGTEEHGRRIRQADVTWIQKGVTKRSQIVERFGSPRFEMPLQSNTTSTTTKTATVQGQSETTITTVQVNEPPKGAKATYLYTRSWSTIPFVAKAHTTQFWLVYDEKGIVQDYGLVGDTPVNPRLN